MLKAVLFDMDGTITELTLPLEAMRSDTKKFFLERGLPSSLLTIDDGISSTKYKAKTYFSDNGISEEDWKQMELDLDVVLNSHEGDAAKNTLIIPGTLESVQQIRTLGLKTAVLTNNGRHAVDIILQTHPFHEYFDIIQTRNESPNPKPYPDGLLKLVRYLNLKVDEVVYVGDARIDAAAAQAAGIEFWGVSTGETSKQVLVSVGSDLVFSSLNEVAKEVKNRIDNELD
ncbi:MAG: HAD-IA family hydrolase [Candidatus Lokiarchaeota archaeon]|nr:HAD-IA family hydrolase [Candidatus Lokiarchaeota archaeon]